MTESNTKSNPPPRPPRHTSLRTPPISFAHRGAKAHAPENTLEAFSLAVKLGATGIESDVYVTADGEAVLDHDGVVGSFLRKKRIGEVRRSELPSHIPTLDELYETVGSDLQLSLDVMDPSAFDAVVGTARNVNAETNLWLCFPHIDQLVQWRTRTSAVLVDSPGRKRIEEGVERRTAKLADLGIDALNRPCGDWNAGQVATTHRFGLFALGWDAHQHRQITAMIDMGIDGFYSDHVDRMTECMELFF